ncbi:DUF1302 family protein [Rudaea sp.]|jgi:hypothetical protein|uniref:DUF1302 family protein n=1 Tax=Rudaea sp. TaxID=2136325 RepID=UPI002F9383FC
MGLLSLAIMNSIALAADDPATSTDSDNSSNSSVQIGGFIRSETAINTDSANPYNQKGNIFNGVAISRSSPVVPPLYTDTVVRNGGSDDHRLDMQAFRGQLDVTAHFSDDFSGVAKLRAIYDPGWYDEYSPSAVGSHAVGAVYHDPNYFKYSVQGLARPNPLEWAGRNYMIDFPALFMEYNHGPLDVRLGNQQIAWGQALFFRVLDVPDGLDLRRHSVLDYVPEEYSDKRVPALAARISYQFDNAWLVDGYVQKFQPSILGNPNTPYNIIPAQFTVHDLYGQYNDKVDFGLRAKGSVGDFGVQAIYAQRYNPDGVYRWTQSGVNRDIPGIPGSGQALQCSPFEVDSTGVWSSNEWFNYAAASRLNGVGGLNAAINDFPCSQALGAVPVPNYTYASYELNQFFQLAGGLLTGNAAGGLRGHIARDYKKEDDIGGGLSYTFSGAPGSITDQLIMNWEVLYVPNRTFTAPDLNINYLRTNEWTTALVLEKYQRFSDSLPATYIVAQFLYKSKSDLFGRYIGDQDGGGYGGNQFKNATGYGGGFKALAFAIQQPFPNLIWRFDLAVLYDLQGGVLIQPAVRWKPNGKVTAELFYNYINSHIGGNPYGNMFGGLDYAKELTLRVGYQF